MKQTWNSGRSRIARSIRGLGLALTVVVAVVGHADAAIVANLEAPNSNELASGIGNVQGWAFSTTPGDEIKTNVDVYIDGQYVMQVPCCSDRADVKAVHPSAPILTGFSGAFNFQSLSPGPHTMEVHFASKFGESHVVSTSFGSESLGSYAFNKKLLFEDASVDFCSPTNVVENGEMVARLICSGVEFTNGAGFTEHCADTIEMTWIKSAQGFRVSKGCNLIDWVKPPFTIEPGLVTPGLLGGN